MCGGEIKRICVLFYFDLFGFSLGAYVGRREVGGDVLFVWVLRFIHLCTVWVFNPSMHTPTTLSLSSEAFMNTNRFAPFESLPLQYSQ